MDDVHPFIRRIVQALVGNPVTSYYVAKAQLSSGQNPEPGVLELTQVQ
jgi:multisubunit Na+/H+ antiporter MnhG subunit